MLKIGDSINYEWSIWLNSTPAGMEWLECDGLISIKFLLCDFCRFYPVELQNCFQNVEQWKMTSREDNLNRGWLLITVNQLNLLYDIYSWSLVRLKTICKFLKRWRTTFRKDDLNRRQHLITGNQLNLLCNVYRCSPKELKTSLNFLNANYDYW